MKRMESILFSMPLLFLDTELEIALMAVLSE